MLVFGDVAGILVWETDCIICGIHVHVNAKLGLIGLYVRIC